MQRIEKWGRDTVYPVSLGGSGDGERILPHATQGFPDRYAVDFCSDSDGWFAFTQGKNDGAGKLIVIDGVSFHPLRDRIWIVRTQGEKMAVEVVGGARKGRIFVGEGIDFEKVLRLLGEITAHGK